MASTATPKAQVKVLEAYKIKLFSTTGSRFYKANPGNHLTWNSISDQRSGAIKRALIPKELTKTKSTGFYECSYRKISRGVFVPISYPRSVSFMEPSPPSNKGGAFDWCPLGPLLLYVSRWLYLTHNIGLKERCFDWRGHKFWEEKVIVLFF